MFPTSDPEIDRLIEALARGLADGQQQQRAAQLFLNVSSRLLEMQMKWPAVEMLLNMPPPSEQVVQLQRELMTLHGTFDQLVASKLQSSYDRGYEAGHRDGEDRLRQRIADGDVVVQVTP